MAHSKFYKFAAISATVLAMVLSLLPPRSFNAFESFQIQFLDKVLHLCFYTVLSFLWTATLYNSKFFKKTIWSIAGIVAAYGAILELMQLFTEGRNFEWADLACNAIGAVLGTVIVLKRWPYHGRKIK